MAMLFAQHPKKTFYQRGTIACQKCAAPIYVFRLKTLPDEFSLRCSKCGDRGFYLKQSVTVDELPERRRKPRN
jgi:hypothetical protein